MDIDSLLPIGAYMFRFLFSGPQPVKISLVFVQVPEPTNVFTVMGTFFHDFRLLGVTLRAVLYRLFFINFSGILCGLLR